ncbi:diguanylate cyclase [Aquabacterium fontiphilum]|nr:diguanylate cyclase [Aquabacterium fontiphilum]
MNMTWKRPWRRLLDLVLGTEPKLRGRVKLSMIAVYGYVISSMLLAYGMDIGLVEQGWGWVLMAYIWVGMPTFYLLVRTDLSSRLGNPGMDLPQCLYAIVAILFAYVITGPVRSSVLMLVSLVLVFGMFTLSARQVVIMGVFTVLGLGVVMTAMVWQHPDLFDARLEFIKFVLTACTLPALSAVAFYVAQVRERLVQRKQALREALARLEQVAMRDELTGLYNRRHMQALVEQQALRQQRSGEGFCLAIIDLDHFKQINDRLGHQAGDQVLGTFARVAGEVMRQTDTLARWGGEEFLLMFTAPDPGTPGVEAALDRLRRAAAAAHWPAGIHVTFSAGVTAHPLGEPLHETLERADRGLYEAKAAGRNRTVVLPAPSATRPTMQGELAETGQV